MADGGAAEHVGLDFMDQVTVLAAVVTCAGSRLFFQCILDEALDLEESLLDRLFSVDLLD